MHHLPFGAKMTEKLFRIVQERHAAAKEPDCLWSFVWGSPSRFFHGGVSWVLTTIPKNQAEVERLFIVEGISFYISYEVEPYVTDQVFDWHDRDGVVSHAA